MKWLLAFLRKIKDKVEDHFAQVIAAAFIGVFSFAVIFFWKWAIVEHSIKLYGWIWLLLYLIVFFLLIHFVCRMFDKVRKIKDPADIRNVLERCWMETKEEEPNKLEFTLFFSGIDKTERLKKGSAQNYLPGVITKDGKWSIVRGGSDTLLVKRKESRKLEVLRNSKSSFK